MNNFMPKHDILNILLISIIDLCKLALRGQVKLNDKKVRSANNL